MADPEQPHVCEKMIYPVPHEALCKLHHTPLQRFGVWATWNNIHIAILISMKQKESY